MMPLATWIPVAISTRIWQLGSNCNAKQIGLCSSEFPANLILGSSNLATTQMACICCSPESTRFLAIFQSKK
jgi:hypothetical protein